MFHSSSIKHIKSFYVFLEKFLEMHLHNFVIFVINNGDSRFMRCIPFLWLVNFPMIFNLHFLFFYFPIFFLSEPDCGFCINRIKKAVATSMRIFNFLPRLNKKNYTKLSIRSRDAVRSSKFTFVHCSSII